MSHYLFNHGDLEDIAGGEHYELGSSPPMSNSTLPAYTGIVFPRRMEPGQIISVDGARQIAARLLLAADLHSDITEAAIMNDREWRENNKGGIEFS